jgi:heme A synthase
MRAYAGAILVLVAPGILVAALWRLRLSELRTWAAVPVLSYAAVFALGEATTITRIPFGVASFLILLAALGVAVALIARRRHVRDTGDETAARGTNRGELRART